MTDAQRRANDKWDRANRTMMGVKVYRDKAAAFKIACYSNGTTPNAVFTEAMDAFMNANGGWDYWLCEAGGQSHGGPCER